MSALLGNGHSLEFFIEGGRSRDGGIQRPRLGLLSMVVNSQLDEQCPKVCATSIVPSDTSSVKQALTIVPTTISYDSPLEEASMLREVAGAPKQKEQLFPLLATAVRLVQQLCAGPRDGLSQPPSGAGGRCGCVVISFGEPVNVKRFLKVQLVVMHGVGDMVTRDRIDKSVHVPAS